MQAAITQSYQSVLPEEAAEALVPDLSLCLLPPPSHPYLPSPDPISTYLDDSSSVSGKGC